MKIKKNLSDEEMFKGFVEKETFETIVLVKQEDKKNKNTDNKQKQSMLSLPAATIEKLDKEILQLRIDCKKRDISEIKWQVSTKGDEIILKAISKK